MNDLAAMRVFIKVVETGGLSAAGRALGLAPPTITRRINELEDVLGVRLLQRSTRKLSLTEAGETYFERAREIVEAVDEANLAVTEKRSEPSGTLRITVPASVARLHLAPALAHFQMQYPKLRVVMRVTDQRVDIIEEGMDAAIRIGRLEDSSLIARKVGESRRLICASPEYLKRAGQPEHPDDLSDHACLTYRSHSGSNLWRFSKGKKIYDVQASGPFFTDNGEVLVAAASAALGLILAPEWLVGNELDNGRLREVLEDYTLQPAMSPLYALYAPGPYVAPKIRSFIDFLVDRFSRDYVWGKPH